MSFLRNHWPDIGIVLAFLIGGWLIFFSSGLSGFQILLWISFISLLLHEFEEYRFPGTFPCRFNRVFFKSQKPDRYPLNTDTSLWVNVFFGWTVYLLAAILAEKAMWICIISIMVSVGNIIIHVFVFNIKGKTLYNPGMATSLLLFLPISLYFFLSIYIYNLTSVRELLVWVPLGFVIAVALTLGTVQVMKNKHTRYVFSKTR